MVESIGQFSSLAQPCPILRDPMDYSRPGPPSITSSQSSPKLMSIELVMPSNHLVLCHPLLLLPSIFPSIFSNESVLHIRWPKYWSFSFSISLSNEQGYGFSSSHVWMWELDYKESWAPKNRCFWTVVLEKTLESPLDGKEITPVNLKGNQSWIFIERTDAEAEAPILWPPDAKNWHTGKDSDAGKDCRQEEKGDDRGWDGWMASLTGWTWVWASSGSWWWTGKLGVLQSVE